MNVIYLKIILFALQEICCENSKGFADNYQIDKCIWERSDILGSNRKIRHFGIKSDILGSKQFGIKHQKVCLCFLNLMNEVNYINISISISSSKKKKKILTSYGLDQGLLGQLGLFLSKHKMLSSSLGGVYLPGVGYTTPLVLGLDM